MSKFISVSERRPDIGVPVLTYSPDCGVNFNKLLHFFWLYEREGVPTHWMPLPEREADGSLDAETAADIGCLDEEALFLLTWRLPKRQEKEKPHARIGLMRASLTGGKEMNNKVLCGSIPYSVVASEYKIWRVALCDGRHPIPDASDGAIFPADVNPLDVDGLQATAEQWIADHIHGQWVKHDYAHVLTVDGIIHLYVTGLTVALVAAINAASVRGVPIVLWHYDRTTGGFYPQDVPCTILGNVDPI